MGGGEIESFHATNGHCEGRKEKDSNRKKWEKLGGGRVEAHSSLSFLPEGILYSLMIFQSEPTVKISKHELNFMNKKELVNLYQI